MHTALVFIQPYSCTVRDTQIKPLILSAEGAEPSLAEQLQILRIGLQRRGAHSGQTQS